MTKPRTPSPLRMDSVDTFVLRSPDAILAALPYLLGFAPEDSIVLVWIGRRRITLTQRLDLPDPGTDPEPWLTAMWAHAGVDVSDEIVVVLVTDRPDANDLAVAVLDRAGEHALDVRDVLRVDGDRWWSLMCHDSECCPPAGRHIDERVRAEVAAEFTVRGVAPLGARDELARLITSDPAAACVVAPFLATAGPPSTRDGDARERWRDDSIAAIVATLPPTEAVPTDADRLAVLIAGLEDVRVRDTILWEATRLESEDLQSALPILAEAVRAAPIGRAAPVATCYAVAAWLVGDGARALVALERALADDPEYSLGLLVLASIQGGLPPVGWRETMRGMSRDDCRRSV